MALCSLLCLQAGTGQVDQQPHSSDSGAAGPGVDMHSPKPQQPQLHPEYTGQSAAGAAMRQAGTPATRSVIAGRPTPMMTVVVAGPSAPGADKVTWS